MSVYMNEYAHVYVYEYDVYNVHVSDTYMYIYIRIAYVRKRTIHKLRRTDPALLHLLTFVYR